MPTPDPRPTEAIVDQDIPPMAKGTAMIVRINPDGTSTEEQRITLSNPGTVQIPAGTRCYVHELNNEWVFKNFV